MQGARQYGVLGRALSDSATLAGSHVAESDRFLQHGLQPVLQNLTPTGTPTGSPRKHLGALLPGATPPQLAQRRFQNPDVAVLPGVTPSPLA